MSLPRSLAASFVAALIMAALPTTAHAQSTRRTACNDGTTISATGAEVCEKHGGINKARTTVLNRAPVKHTEAGRVAQAGTPKEREKPRYEEHRGWRWSRHHDDHKAEKHKGVLCKDGRYDPAEGKGHQLCKHHGGLAH